MAAGETAKGHLGMVEFQTSPPRLAEGVGAVRRDLHRLLEAAFGGGKVVTPAVGAREIEEE
jgi:hypothetical protein